MNPLTLKSRFAVIRVSPQRWLVVEFAGISAATNVEHPAAWFEPVGKPLPRDEARRVLVEKVKGEQVGQLCPGGCQRSPEHCQCGARDEIG